MRTTLCLRTDLTLRNPIMAASGTLGYGIEYAERLDLAGLGALVCKGTTSEPRAGNEPLRLVETPAGMLNAIGLQNVGIDAVVREMAPRWRTLPLPVLVNISATSVDEYAAMAARLDGVPGVAGIEVNVSCPNVEAGGVQFGTDARLAQAVTRAVRAAGSLPLLVKLSPNVVDIAEIARAVESEGADAICVANTLYGMAIDVRQRRPVLAGVRGGLSGPAIKPHFLYLTYEVAAAVSVPVVGLGGILTAGDALEFLLAGASAVQLATALLLDPNAWRGVVEGIETWLRREGVRDLSDIIGAANRRHKKPAGEHAPTGG